VLFEDLKNIKKLSVAAWISSSPTVVVTGITRVSVWLYPSYSAAASAQHGSEQVLMIEADVLLSEQQGLTVSTSRTETCYGKLKIAAHYCIDCSKAIGSVQGTGQNSTICLRLPYESQDTRTEKSRLKMLDSCSFDLPKELQNPNTVSSVGIHCTFCQAPLVVSGTLDKAHELPSGMLDHVRIT
jgi:hypothetical protein